MMGRLKSEQAQLFYQFQLDDAVPEDQLVRKIYSALDLSWLRSELVGGSPVDRSGTAQSCRLEWFVVPFARL